jgi:osmotically-inducible protein OsmY
MAAAAIDGVQSRAQAALTNSPFYELRELKVEHHGGALVISGCVSSFYHKQLAQEVVRSVCADAEVINSIFVRLHDESES